MYENFRSLKRITARDMSALRLFSISSGYPALVAIVSMLSYLSYSPVDLQPLMLCLSVALLISRYTHLRYPLKVPTSNKPRHLFTRTDPKCLELQRTLALHTLKHKIDCAGLIKQNARLTTFVESLRKDISSNAFAAFRDRLLLTNKIWKQEKELKVLRHVVESEDARLKGVSEDPATSDRDVRALEEKLEELERRHLVEIAEREEMDERKEKIVDELLREITADLEESQRLVKSLCSRISEHDLEVEMICDEWLQDNQHLANEVAKLKLGERTRVIDMDQTLVGGELEGGWKLDEKAAADDIQDDEALEDSSSDMGSPTPTVADDSEYVYALDDSSPSPSPKKSTFNPIFLFHPQSPVALALNGANPYTTSTRLLARCKRAGSGRMPIKLPLWARRGSDSPDAVGRLAKRIRVNSSGA